jgi:hypothetical protein
MSHIVDRIGTSLEPRFAAARRALGTPERTTRTAVVIGRLLGAGMVVVFATGVYSHLLQHPIPGLVLPTRPVSLYQWTQGAHVTIGEMMIPLLLAKLWVVFPRLFEWPAVRSFVHLVERGSIALLVATALLQLLMGTLNTLQWYPWPFSFPRTHWALSWVLIGLIVVHIGVKLPLVLRHWRRMPRAGAHPEAVSDE